MPPSGPAGGVGSRSATPTVARRIVNVPAVPPFLTPCIDPISADEYEGIVDSVRDAIQEDAQPMRIGQGSSGSYFCRNTDGQILGVFKPKDEEPYGELNPKWQKWIHRNVFFCCFGRSCLIPNVGYLSEAGASLLDERLGFGIVPVTKVVALSSPAFYYKKKHRRHPAALPLKVGSFQLFLRGFKDASMFLKLHPLPNEPPAGNFAAAESALPHSRFMSVPEYDGIWDAATYDAFVDQFQRLTILDYLMRNTDRGLDNWMIAFKNGRLQVAAIDHGLAFPFKHPDKWRSYPYGWLYLQISKIPYLPSLSNHVRSLLRDTRWWRVTRTDMHELFAQDEAFDADIFEAQMAVIRGQMYNMLQVL
ncbi:phosphatidylinositol 3 and 4-kinase-domain-containing protein, partial [Blastocladiella britannica]